MNEDLRKSLSASSNPTVNFMIFFFITLLKFANIICKLNQQLLICHFAVFISGLLFTIMDIFSTQNCLINYVFM